MIQQAYKTRETNSDPLTEQVIKQVDCVTLLIIALVQLIIKKLPNKVALNHLSQNNDKSVKLHEPWSVETNYMQKVGKHFKSNNKHGKNTLKI